MKFPFQKIGNAVIHFIFPHICEGCGSDLRSAESFLCLKCIDMLPYTDFHLYPANPVEKIFWGRLPVTHASAQFYFTKTSIIQRLMHQFKYHGNRQLGFYLGQLMGYSLSGSNRFLYLDALIPLPLFESRERRRGFNQAAVLCEGISSVLGIPVMKNVIKRSSFTETQTKKGRLERWKNMEGKFCLQEAISLVNKHVLLVDDVITTGATLESCGSELLRIPGIRVSIATLCYAAGA
jgi:ComF family protein